MECSRVNKYKSEATCYEDSQGAYLKASNSISSNGGVSTAHVGRRIDIVKRGCNDKGFHRPIFREGIVFGSASAEQSSKACVPTKTEASIEVSNKCSGTTTKK